MVYLFMAARQDVKSTDNLVVVHGQIKLKRERRVLVAKKKIFLPFAIPNYIIILVFMVVRARIM